MVAIPSLWAGFSAGMWLSIITCVPGAVTWRAILTTPGIWKKSVIAGPAFPIKGVSVNSYNDVGGNRMLSSVPYLSMGRQLQDAGLRRAGGL